VQPAAALAATALRICSARLLGQQTVDLKEALGGTLQIGAADMDGSAAVMSSSNSNSSSSNSADHGAGCGSSSTERRSSSAAWNSNSSDCMSRSLIAARHAAIKLAGWFAIVFSYEVSEELQADAAARQLLESDDLMLLLVAVMGLVAYASHKQARGQSQVPPPADDWNSSSSPAAVALAGQLTRQQRRLQLRQQQRQMLRVPPFHQAALLAAGLTEADLVGSELGSNPFRMSQEWGATRIIRAHNEVLNLRANIAQGTYVTQQGMLGLYPAQLYACYTLLTIELVVLTPSLGQVINGLGLLIALRKKRTAVEEAYGVSATAGVAAAMAVTCSNGQQYCGTLLLQPLLQLLVPTVQHLLDTTAAEAVQLPAAHSLVQNRVALLSYACHCLLGLLTEGEKPPARPCIALHCR
jgi:hypothetical protein